MTTPALEFQAETQLPTEFGQFRFRVYKNIDGEEVIAIATNNTDHLDHVSVRVHSACFTAEVVGSLKCDCKQQLDFSLSYIAKRGGIVIYLPQEGRGIGLSNKIKAYALQEDGHDTIEANSLLGLPIDNRSYHDAAAILADFKVDCLHLITNNPAKITALQSLGFQVVSRIPVPAISNCHSTSYLETKRVRMGHMLNTSAVKQQDSAQQKSGLDRPYIHLNFAIDHLGRMNHADGQQSDLSCDKDWQRVHQLREQYSAVVVGARTWRLDNPQLTVREDRLGRVPQHQPDRVIFAGHTPCQVNPDARRSFMISVPRNADPNCINITATERDLEQPLKTLFQHGVKSALVEGGMTLLSSFISQNMFDRLTFYVSTKSIDEAIHALSDKFTQLPINLMEAVPLGKGIVVSYTPNSVSSTGADAPSPQPVTASVQ